MPESLERAALVAEARKGFTPSIMRETADFLMRIGNRKYGDIRDRADALRFGTILDTSAAQVAEHYADRAIEQEAIRQALAKYPNPEAMRDVLKEALRDA